MVILPPLLLGVLVASASAPSLAPPRAHPGPSIWGEITLEKDAMTFLIEGAADPLTENLGLDRLLLGPMEESEEARLRSAIDDFFQRNVPVLLDGRAVLPELEELVIQDGVPEDADFMSARIVLKYRCTDLPRQMSVTWHGFEGEDVDYIPVVIRLRRDGSPRMFSFFPDEPQYVWHAADVRPRRARTDLAVAAPAVDRPAVPLPALVVLLLGIGLLAVRRPRPLEGSATIMVALLLAVFLRDVGRVEVPFLGGGRAALPAPDQARQIFESLHRNIYDAFEADTEEGIYERLAASVDNRLLDDLYGDVYESLILREQGGAVCGVDSIEVLDGAVDTRVYEERDVAEYRIDWKWRVHGVVSHWGHIHRRTNEYRALYTVRHDGERWKIAEAEVLEHQRVDDD